MNSPSAFEPTVHDAREAEFDRALRPSDFSEFVGQESLMTNLKVMIQAAREREEVLEHLLFTGLPGLGKTSLSMALSRELTVPIKVTSGPGLERAKDLVGILSTLERGTVLFIDEIHRLPRVVEEYLYGAMERFQLEFTLDQGVHARLLKLDLAPFTLVGATTREALLSAPFRSRFGQVLRFEPYSLEALEEILFRAAGRLGCSLDPDARQRLARHSRGVPRLAHRLLRRARDVAQVAEKTSIDSESVERTFELLDIDERGLERTDRRLLQALADAGGGPVGLKALSATLDEPEDTLADVFEPWLIQQGWIARTPQGRVLREPGWRLLGLEPASPHNEAP